MFICLVYHHNTTRSLQLLDKAVMKSFENAYNRSEGSSEFGVDEDILNGIDQSAEGLIRYTESFQ